MNTKSRNDNMVDEATRQRRPHHRPAILNISEKDYRDLRKGLSVICAVPNDLICTSRCGERNEHFWERRASLVATAVRGDYRTVFVRYRAGAGAERLKCDICGDVRTPAGMDGAWFSVRLVRSGEEAV